MRPQGQGACGYPSGKVHPFDIHLHDPVGTLAKIHRHLPSTTRDGDLAQFVHDLCVDLIVFVAWLGSLHALRRHTAGHHEGILIHLRISMET